MQTYREILESLKSPYPYKIKRSPGSFEAEWEIPGTMENPYSMDYSFQALRSGLEFGFDGSNENNGLEDAWNVEFMADVPAMKYFGTDILGTGNAFRVFATVSAIMKDFIKSVNPEIFYFSAEEPSRIRLYDKFAKIIKKVAGYKFVKLHGNDVLYILSKRKLTLNNLPDWYQIVKRS